MAMQMNPAAMVAQQNIAIKENLRELTAAVDAYSTACEKNATAGKSDGELEQSHVKLMTSVKQMRSAIYGPMNMVTSHFEEGYRSGCFRTLLEMGVVEALPIDGTSISATALAEKLQVDKTLLIRLMRMVVPIYFEERTPEQYTHNPNSMVYLFPPLRGGFKMMFDEFGLPGMKLWEFFKENGYTNPNSLTKNPFTYAHQTKGLNMFEFLAQDPVRFKTFNDAMQAQTSQNIQSYGIFPFEEVYGKANTTDDSVLLVDIGGGKGQATSAIKALCPNIKGKMILQDRPEVIEDITDPLPGIEKMGYDFFTPQPVKGALAYYIRRCLHDWPEDECIVILQTIAAAMIPGTSRLLIAEIVLPPGSGDTEAAWMDITMMTFGGMERTKEQWVSLLEKSGFELEKIHESQGTTFSVIEAVLKDK